MQSETNYTEGSEEYKGAIPIKRPIRPYLDMVSGIYEVPVHLQKRLITTVHETKEIGTDLMVSNHTTISQVLERKTEYYRYSAKDECPYIIADNAEFRVLTEIRKNETQKARREIDAGIVLPAGQEIVWFLEKTKDFSFLGIEHFDWEHDG